MATGDFGVLQTEEAISLNSRAQEIKAKIERYETGDAVSIKAF